MPQRHWIISLLAVGLLVGCQTDESIAGFTTPETVWQLQSFNAEEITATFTIQFDADGQTFGQADCNRYTTQQNVPYPWIEFGPIAATRALCPEAELENRFYNALTAADQVEIVGNTLLITGPDIELVFKSGD